MGLKKSISSFLNRLPSLTGITKRTKLIKMDHDSETISTGSHTPLFGGEYSKKGQDEPELSGQQSTLNHSLGKKDSRLSKMYLGGLFALNQYNNPDKLCLCAHSMRELMEKLPEYLDIPKKSY